MGGTEEQLEFLGRLGPARLRELRLSISDRLVADLIRLVGAMDEEAMRTVLKLPELEEPEIADAVLETAHQFDLRPHLARFADVVDGDSASASGPWSSARRGTAGCTTISVRCGRGWRNSLVACAHERSRRSTR